jgi:methyl-accepting chemotaxis protein
VADCLQTRLDGDLGESFERMVVSLRELVGEIQANAQSLNDTAAQLHEAALSQQLGASEQASAVEETRRILSTLSTSAKEIASATSAVYSNAEVAQQTNNQTAEAIRELSGHTARIGEIVSFIKDVANKSDLLALNAALEGTKAGDAGRSFSLVATQMQRLAEQIMGSLKDIDALTEDIRRATRSTVSAVEETSRLSTQTTQSAGAIAEAIQEQQVGTQQSTTAMDQISAVAQKSVSTSSDLVGASKQLQGLSTTFQRVVSHFHTTGTSRAAPRTDRRAA